MAPSHHLETTIPTLRACFYLSASPQSQDFPYPMANRRPTTRRRLLPAPQPDDGKGNPATPAGKPTRLDANPTPETHGRGVIQTRDDWQPLAFVAGLPGQQASSDKTLIRTHAMQDVMRRRHDPNAKNYEHVAESAGGAVDQTRKFRLDTDRIEIYKTAKERKRDAGASAVKGKGKTVEEDREGGDGLRGLPEDFTALMSKTSSGDTEPLFPQSMTFSTAEDPDAIVMDGAFPFDVGQRSHTRLDPFESTPVKIDPSTKRLIDQFHRTDRPSWCPTINKEWLRCAMSDNALFHATMWHFAAHQRRSGVSGPLQDDSVEQLTHQFEAIRLVNQRLNQPERLPSDETIAAVACIADVATSFSSLETSSMHVSGLRQLVAMRGGVGTLGMNGLLRRLVYWIEENHTSRRKVSVRFPAFVLSRRNGTDDDDDSSERLSLPQQSSSIGTRKEYRAKTSHTLNGSVRPDLQSTLEELKSLSNLFRTTSHPSLRASQLTDLSTRLSLIEQQLLTLVHPYYTRPASQHPAKPASGRVTIASCSALAALLQAQLQLRVQPPGLRTEHAATRLYEVLVGLEGKAVPQWEVSPFRVGVMLVLGAEAGA